MDGLPTTAASILIVDDHGPNIRLLEFLLDAAGYTDVRGVTDPCQALAVCAERRPDLILLDLHMPRMDGLTLMKLILEQVSDEVYFPILVLTGDVTPEAKRRALSLGAKDFLAKPIDAGELSLRVKNLIETRALYKHIEKHTRTVEHTVEEQARQLAKTQVEILQRLALAAEYRDDQTGQHTQRVGMLAAMLARTVGRPAEEADLLRLSAPLHDIGKIAVPDRIFTKPGKLTAEEFTIMKSHTTVGAEILNGSQFAVLQMAGQIALSHHEKWDGTGYPQGLAGEEIPLPARITAIADVFDALTHARPYKSAWTLEKAMETIEHGRNHHFDPALVTSFLSLLEAEGLNSITTTVDIEGKDWSAVANAVEGIR